MTWKDVPGYEGLYKINQKGDVLSLRKKGASHADYILTPTNDGRGYKQVCMTKGGKTKSEKVHRLVALAFIPNPNGYTEINHIDEDKWNSDVTNLEWCTRTYNVNYGKRTEKTSTKVAMYSLKMEFIREYKSIREACRENGFRCPGNISNVVNGISYTAYGYRWRKVV